MEAWRRLRRSRSNDGEAGDERVRDDSRAPGLEARARNIRDQTVKISCSPDPTVTRLMSDVGPNRMPELGLGFGRKRYSNG